ncbi:MAG: EFR1 family ferrodoxin [Syntrophomonadaceae bacterium]|nr:EFR1 family ferrodoxin [Syntrophomonadaceae bacterium]
MEAEIFYFSGTGNSLVIARDIAIRLDAREIPIASLIDKVTVRSDADVVGIVFPVHNVANGGVPAIVRRFAAALQTRYDAYIFAVCSCGAGSGEALPNIAKILQTTGQKLAAGFTVKMPFNCPPFTDRAAQAQRFQEWHKILEEVCATVMDYREIEIKEFNAIIKGAVLPLGVLMQRSILKNYRKLAQDNSLDFDEAVRHSDRSYEVDDKCDGCGICAGICPVDNIAMADERPAWRHRCESCLACLVWCPRTAISGGILSGREERYHHPRVKLKDMLQQKTR